MNRIVKMKQLKNKGLSYGLIGKLFHISRQRVHQLINGYKSPANQNKNIILIYEFIFKRDNYICQLCEKRGTLIHHIDKNDLNNSFNNLICLCNKCHLNLHRPKLPKMKILQRDKRGRIVKSGICS